MEDNPPHKQHKSIIGKERIFNVRRRNYKNLNQHKYQSPYLTPFKNKHKQLEARFQKHEQKDKKQLQEDDSIRIEILQSKPYQQLKKRYNQLKQNLCKEKQSRVKALQEKQQQLKKIEQEKQRLAAEKDKLQQKRNQLKEKLQKIRITNEELEEEEAERNEEERIMNIQYIRNMIISLRYQNGIDIDPDSMTYEELLQLQEKMGSVSKGLSKDKIAKLPRKNYEQGQICCICLEEGLNEMMILPCKHCFHDGCIGEWLEKEKVCPNCKQQILIQ